METGLRFISARAKRCLYQPSSSSQEVGQGEREAEEGEAPGLEGREYLTALLNT